MIGTCDYELWAEATGGGKPQAQVRLMMLHHVLKLKQNEATPRWSYANFMVVVGWMLDGHEVDSAASSEA